MRFFLSVILTGALSMGASDALAGANEADDAPPREFYGQLNPAFIIFDDGGLRTTALADSSHSGSRVGFWFRQDLNDGEFSFNLEVDVGLIGTASQTQNLSLDAWDFNRQGIRRVDLAFRTDTAGTFSLGQGSMASDGAADVDLSGTVLVNYVSVADTAGGFRFRSASGALTPVFVRGAYRTYDGGRRGRVRYDTPDLGGFTLSAAYGTEVVNKSVDVDYRDVALRYAGEFGDISLRAALAWSDVRPAILQDSQFVMGSVSAVHRPSGWNLTAAAGSEQGAGRYIYAKLGYLANWLSLGRTAIALDVYDGRDINTPGARSRAFGLGVVQTLEARDLELYLGLRKYEYDDDTQISYLDASSVQIGMRWQF